MNKYISYDTDITPEGKKHYLPGVSRVSQNHTYTAYVQYFWQGNHKYTVHTYIPGQPFSWQINQLTKTSIGQLSLKCEPIPRGSSHKFIHKAWPCKAVDWVGHKRRHPVLINIYTTCIYYLHQYLHLFLSFLVITCIFFFFLVITCLPPALSMNYHWSLFGMFAWW